MKTKNIILYIIFFQAIFAYPALCTYGSSIQATQVSVSVESNKTHVESGEGISICYLITNMCDYTARSIDVYTTIPDFLYFPRIEAIRHNSSEDKVTRFGNHGFRFQIRELKAHQLKSFCYATQVLNENLQNFASNGSSKCALATNITVLRSGIYIPKILISKINLSVMPSKSELPITKPQIIEQLE